MQDGKSWRERKLNFLKISLPDYMEVTKKVYMRTRSEWRNNGQVK